MKYEHLAQRVQDIELGRDKGEKRPKAHNTSVLISTRLLMINYYSQLPTTVVLTTTFANDITVKSLQMSVLVRKL